MLGLLLPLLNIIFKCDTYIRGIDFVWSQDFYQRLITVLMHALTFSTLSPLFTLPGTG